VDTISPTASTHFYRFDFIYFYMVQVISSKRYPIFDRSSVGDTMSLSYLEYQAVHSSIIFDGISIIYTELDDYILVLETVIWWHQISVCWNIPFQVLPPPRISCSSDD